MGGLFSSKKTATVSNPEVSAPVEQATFEPTAEDSATKKKKTQQSGKSSLVIARNTGSINTAGGSGTGLSV